MLLLILRSFNKQQPQPRKLMGHKYMYMYCTGVPVNLFLILFHNYNLCISDQGIVRLKDKLKNFVIIVQSTKDFDMHATNLETCLIPDVFLSVLCAEQHSIQLLVN